MCSLYRVCQKKLLSGTDIRAVYLANGADHSVLCCPKTHGIRNIQRQSLTKRLIFVAFEKERTGLILVGAVVFARIGRFLVLSFVLSLITVFPRARSW